MNDLIERKDVIKVVNAYDDTAYALQDVQRITDGIVKVIKSLPSARPKGEWIAIWGEDGKSTSAYCGECHRVNQRPLGDFCKWCGADMRGREGE